jgi:hypothetical protein
VAFCSYLTSPTGAELRLALSIQGAVVGMGWVRAPDEDVNRYLDWASGEVLACRARGRHRLSTTCGAAIYVSGVADDGPFIRRLTCRCCELGEKAEKWERVKARFHRVGSTPDCRTGRSLARE